MIDFLVNNIQIILTGLTIIIGIWGVYHGKKQVSYAWQAIHIALMSEEDRKKEREKVQEEVKKVRKGSPSRKVIFFLGLLAIILGGVFAWIQFDGHLEKVKSEKIQPLKDSPLKDSPPKEPPPKEPPLKEPPLKELPPKEPPLKELPPKELPPKEPPPKEPPLKEPPLKDLPPKEPPPIPNICEVNDPTIDCLWRFERKVQ